MVAKPSQIRPGVDTLGSGLPGPPSQQSVVEVQGMILMMFVIITGRRDNPKHVYTYKSYNISLDHIYIYIYSWNSKGR